MWGQVSVTSSACPRHLSGGHDEWDQGACQAQAWVEACSAVSGAGIGISPKGQKESSACQAQVCGRV